MANSSPLSAPCGKRWTKAASPSCCARSCRASTANSSRRRLKVRWCCRSTATRSVCSVRPPAPTGRKSNPPFSAPCSNALLTPANGTAWAPTTRRAPTSSASFCPPSSNRYANAGPTSRPPPYFWPMKASRPQHSPKSTISTTSSARFASSTPPAAAPIFSM